MRRIGVLSLVVTLIILLLCSSALGEVRSYLSADVEQVLGGPMREHVEERESYLVDKAAQLQTISNKDDTKVRRALVVLNDYLTTEQVLNIIGESHVHYLRAGLRGNTNPILEHFVVQWGTEACEKPLQPSEFVERYVSQILEPEIEFYQANISSLPDNAVAYFEALKELRTLMNEQIGFYAVGVQGTASQLKAMMTHHAVDVVDVVDPKGPAKVRYITPMPTR